jgi:hypothetical protein
MQESTLWSVTVPRAMSIYAVSVFAVLWAGLAVAFLVNRDWLDVIWVWALGLPLLLRILVWLLFLPIMCALWILQSSWPIALRLLGFAGIGAWTLLAASSLLKAFVRSAPAG